jgi:uncharacterized protein YybS (DUF2232 family)
LGTEGGGILIKDFISAVTASSVIFMTAALAPLVGPLADFFIPLPVFFYHARLGRIRGLAVFCLSLFAVSAISFLTPLNVDITSLIIFGSFGLVLSEIFKRGLPIEKTVFCAMLAILIAGLLFLGIHLQATGQGPMKMVESYIREGVNESIGVYAQFGMSTEQINEFRKSVPQIVGTIMSLFPALMIISAVAFALVNVLIGTALMRRAGIPFPDFGDLTLWKIPDQMVWLVIAAGALILVPREEIRLVGLNLLIVFLFTYLFQGFAVISHFFKRKNVPVFLRWVAYVLIFVQNFLFLVVIAVGFADIWLDFRKMSPPTADSVKQQ